MSIHVGGARAREYPVTLSQAFVVDYGEAETYHTTSGSTGLSNPATHHLAPRLHYLSETESKTNNI